MILVLITALGLGIWIPFTIGKSAALLSVCLLLLLRVAFYMTNDFRSWILIVFCRSSIFQYGQCESSRIQ
jgi:hypothetical protein